MSVRLRAIYSNGVFTPEPGQLPPDFPEKARVELTIEAAETEMVDEAARRAALLREIAESMKANQIRGNPPHFTRECLHERG